MSGRFASFSFVDRITRRDGARIEGRYTVPPQASRFPASLMAEAVGQLAAWASMAQLDFGSRPVAGLAAEARYFVVPQPGQTLELEADIERCDGEAVAYSGRASVDGRPAVQLIDCVGPMLPMAQFDDADRVRGDFATLLGPGAAAGRFGGVPELQLDAAEQLDAEHAAAWLQVPSTDDAPYFADHFPRRPVFPGTLLMDALATLALQLAGQCAPLHGKVLVAKKVSNVKIRAFTEPGTRLRLDAGLIDADAAGARLKLSARAAGGTDVKTVATARIEVGPRSGP